MWNEHLFVLNWHLHLFIKGYRWTTCTTFKYLTIWLLFVCYLYAGLMSIIHSSCDIIVIFLFVCHMHTPNILIFPEYIPAALLITALKIIMA